MRLRRSTRAVIVSAVAVIGVLATAGSAAAGPCYQVTVYDTSGNPRSVTVCPGD